MRYLRPTKATNTRTLYSATILTLANLALSACFVISLVKTAPWPQISDDVLMHYVVFLMHHGMEPYRQIVDPNMPGSYLIDASVFAVIGDPTFAWRMFDWLLMAAAAISIVACVGWRHWKAGVFAGLVFALWHLADGVAQAGQRDFILSVCLLAGAAALLRFMRHSSPKQAVLWGLSVGLATGIKPQAFILLPGMVLVASAVRPRTDPRRLAVWGTGGWLFAVSCVGLWLIDHRAFMPFLKTAHGLMAYHAGMARHSLLFLFSHAVPPLLLLLLTIPMLYALRNGVLRRCEYAVSLAGIAFGVFSFCLQGKAYPYHRYPLLAFLMLIVAVALANANQVEDATYDKYTRVASTLVVVYCALWLGPACAAKALRFDWRDQPSLVGLESDLVEIAGGRSKINGLQNEVQCMDTMAGCITVLDRMHLVQATGFLYDCYLFAPGKSSEKEMLQARFLDAVMRNPPRAFIVTDQWCFNLQRGYEKLSQWPEMNRLLKTHYTLLLQRDAPAEHSKYLATWPFGYRIYVRRNR